MQRSSLSNLSMGGAAAQVERKEYDAASAADEAEVDTEAEANGKEEKMEMVDEESGGSSGKSKSCVKRKGAAVSHSTKRKKTQRLTDAETAELLDTPARQQSPSSASQLGRPSPPSSVTSSLLTPKIDCSKVTLSWQGAVDHPNGNTALRLRPPTFTELERLVHDAFAVPAEQRLYLKDGVDRVLDELLWQATLTDPLLTVFVYEAAGGVKVRGVDHTMSAIPHPEFIIASDKYRMAQDQGEEAVAFALSEKIDNSKAATEKVPSPRIKIKFIEHTDPDVLKKRMTIMIRSAPHRAGTVTSYIVRLRADTRPLSHSPLSLPLLPLSPLSPLSPWPGSDNGCGMSLKQLNTCARMVSVAWSWLSPPLPHSPTSLLYLSIVTVCVSVV